MLSITPFGNIVTSDDSLVSLALEGGSKDTVLDGTISVAVVDGVATFSNLSIVGSGMAELKAEDGLLSSILSKRISV